jgi:hypothetical protein
MIIDDGSLSMPNMVSLVKKGAESIPLIFGMDEEDPVAIRKFLELQVLSPIWM